MTDRSPSDSPTPPAAQRGAGADAETMRAKPAVLRALTDFFCIRNDPVPEEIENFRNVALDLLPDAGPSTRMYVAARLARHPGAPAEVLRFLARQDEACRQVLAQHGVNLPIDAQLEIARQGDRRVARDLASRKDLAKEVSAALIERNDPVVTKALADNDSARVSRESLRLLDGMGRADRQLAAELDARVIEPAVDPADFFEASRLDRERIIASARMAALGAQPIRPPADPEIIGRLAACAMNRDWSEFARTLADKLHISENLVLRMTLDPGGEPLALLLACVGAGREDVVRILLFCDEAISHSYGRVQELTNLATDAPAAVAGALVLAIGGVRPRIATSPLSSDHARRRDPQRPPVLREPAPVSRPTLGLFRAKG